MHSRRVFLAFVSIILSTGVFSRNCRLSVLHPCFVLSDPVCWPSSLACASRGPACHRSRNLPQCQRTVGVSAIRGVGSRLKRLYQLPHGGHFTGAAMAGNVMPSEPNNAYSCHKQESADHFASVHQLNDVKVCGLSLSDHSQAPRPGRRQEQGVAKVHWLPRRHDDYLQSVTARPWRPATRISAACHDCHGLHRIEPVGDRKSHHNR